MHAAAAGTATQFVISIRDFNSSERRPFLQKESTVHCLRLEKMELKRKDVYFVNELLIYASKAQIVNKIRLRFINIWLPWTGITFNVSLLVDLVPSLIVGKAS